MNQKEKCIYLSFNFSFNFSISKSICLFNLLIFLTSFFRRVISVTKVMAKRRTRIDIKGRTSINHFAFLSTSFFSCQPRRTGKKKSMIHPKTNNPTAHSRFFMSHSRVSHSIDNYLKIPGNEGYIYDKQDSTGDH